MFVPNYEIALAEEIFAALWQKKIIYYLYSLLPEIHVPNSNIELAMAALVS